MTLDRLIDTVLGNNDSPVVGKSDTPNEVNDKGPDSIDVNDSAQHSPSTLRYQQHDTDVITDNHMVNDQKGSHDIDPPASSADMAEGITIPGHDPLLISESDPENGDIKKVKRKRKHNSDGISDIDTVSTAHVDRVVSNVGDVAERRPRGNEKAEADRAELFRLVYIEGNNLLTAYRMLYPRKKNTDMAAEKYGGRMVEQFKREHKDQLAEIMEAADMGLPRLAKEINKSLNAEKHEVVASETDPSGFKTITTPDERLRHAGRELLAKVLGATAAQGGNTQVNVGIKFGGEREPRDWESWATERQAAGQEADTR